MVLVYLFSVSDHSNTESSPAAVEMERKRTCEELEGGCPSKIPCQNYDVVHQLNRLNETSI